MCAYSRRAARPCSGVVVAASLAMLLAAATAAWCGSPRPAANPSQEGRVHLRFYRRGIVLEPRSPELATEGGRVLRALLAGTARSSRMLVHDRIVDEEKRTQMAVEFTLPEPVSLPAGVMGVVRTDRVFVPLTGSYAGDGGALLVFVGDGGYERGPFLVPDGRELVAPLLARLEALTPQP